MKKLYTIFIFLFLIFIISGCGSNEIEKQNPYIESSNSQIEESKVSSEESSIEVKEEKTEEIKTIEVITKEEKNEFESQKTQKEKIETKTQEEKEEATKIKENYDGSYLGTFLITGYDICMECCGNTSGITASGTIATVGRTIAADSQFAFGTKLYIEGLGIYIVEDRGSAVKGNVLDVLCNNHEECYAITGYYDVYLVD